jgi:hypothetical protein
MKMALYAELKSNNYSYFFSNVHNQSLGTPTRNKLIGFLVSLLHGLNFHDFYVSISTSNKNFCALKYSMMLIICDVKFSRR